MLPWLIRFDYHDKVIPSEIHLETRIVDEHFNNRSIPTQYRVSTIKANITL